MSRDNDDKDDRDDRDDHDDHDPNRDDRDDFVDVDFDIDIDDCNDKHLTIDLYRIFDDYNS